MSHCPNKSEMISFGKKKKEALFVLFVQNQVFNWYILVDRCSENSLGANRKFKALIAWWKPALLQSNRASKSLAFPGLQKSLHRVL